MANRARKPSRAAPKSAKPGAAPPTPAAEKAPKPTSVGPKAAKPPRAAKPVARKRVAPPPPTTGRYTPPIPRSEKVSPLWVPIIMFAALGLGMAMIILNYVDVLPGGTHNGYLLGGLALITLGFITATKYH